MLTKEDKILIKKCLEIKKVRGNDLLSNTVNVIIGDDFFCSLLL